MSHVRQGTRSKPSYVASLAGMLALLLVLLWLGGCDDDDRRQAGGWTAEGDVETLNNMAFALGDRGATRSRIFQAFTLNPGVPYAITFDFKNNVSGAQPTNPFAFPDTFFASLILLDDATGFDPDSTNFADAMPLFDLAAAGVLNNQGILSPSNLGPQWTHFSLTFTPTHRVVVPAFELLDLNFIDADSAVHLDNIRIRSL
jgi:hypothetical protein